MLTCVQHGTWNDNYCGPDCQALTEQWNDREAKNEEN